MRLPVQVSLDMLCIVPVFSGCSFTFIAPVGLPNIILDPIIPHFYSDFDKHSDFEFHHSFLESRVPEEIKPKFIVASTLMTVNNNCYGSHVPASLQQTLTFALESFSLRGPMYLSSLSLSDIRPSSQRNPEKCQTQTGPCHSQHTSRAACAQ